jgi:hypothetical protein
MSNQPQTFRSRLQRNKRQRVIQHAARVEFLNVQRQLPGFDHGNLQHIVRQPQQKLSGVDHPAVSANRELRELWRSRGLVVPPLVGSVHGIDRRGRGADYFV